MARWQISLLVTGGVLALGTLAGCTTENSPDPAPSPRPDRTSDVRPIEPGDEYVAIGDSYTSAPGTGPSTDDCLQTTTNYPHKVAAKLRLQLKDVSCAGAKTTNVTEPQTVRATRRPPQGEALSPNTDLVTVSLGAGDVRILGIVGYGCTAVRIEDPAGAPCQQADTAGGSSKIEVQIEASGERLANTLKEVAKRAPNARIVMVGYPAFFPKSGPCAALPLAVGDYAFARRVNELMVRAQERAAAQAQAEYVDVFSATQGHDMCSADPWIAGLRPSRTDGAELHPFPEEQQLVSNLIVELLS